MLASLISGTAVAKKPAYTASAPANPSTFVSYGKLVRFDVTWTNTSGANLPHVFVRADTPAGGSLVALVAGPSQGSCGTQTAALLQCSFGAINNGTSVTFSTVYRVPTSGTSFAVKFTFTAQGDTTSDQGGNSRGDDMPVTGSVALRNGTSNDAGGYVLGSDAVVQNNQSLNKHNNPQSAKLDFSASTATNFGATVSEAATSTCAPGVSTCFGDFVVMKVNNGNAVGGGFFVTIGYSSVPGSADGSFIHWLNDDATGTVEGVDFEIVDISCADAAVGQNCIDDTFKNGGSTFYVLHMFENGPMRGF
jgi:hypothetical protein